MTLYLVIGGPLGPAGYQTANAENTEIVGLYSNYIEAVGVWRSAAMRTMDDAETQFFILPLHKMIASILEPESADDG